MCQARVSTCWGNSKGMVKTLAQGAVYSEKVATSESEPCAGQGLCGSGQQDGMGIGAGKGLTDTEQVGMGFLYGQQWPRHIRVSMAAVETQTYDHGEDMGSDSKRNVKRVRALNRGSLF